MPGWRNVSQYNRPIPTPSAATRSRFSSLPERRLCKQQNNLEETLRSYRPFPTTTAFASRRRGPSSPIRYCVSTYFRGLPRAYSLTDPISISSVKNGNVTQFARVQTTPASSLKIFVSCGQSLQQDDSALARSIGRPHPRARSKADDPSEVEVPFHRLEHLGLGVHGTIRSRCSVVR